MGFKSDLFSRKVDENLHCPICRDVFDNPLTCKDGHTFCSECIEEWLQGNKKCPSDNRPLNKKELVCNLTVKGIIENMEVYCNPISTQKTESRPAKRIKIENSPSDDKSTLYNEDDEEENCSWTGKLYELVTHRKSCVFHLVNCPHENCMIKRKRKNLEKHKEKCKYRSVVCKECVSLVVEYKLQQHLENDCPNAMVPCLNNCSTDGEVTKIRRNDLADHLSMVCPKAPVNCPYKEQGCVAQIERQDVEKHIQEDMAGHMMLLAKECSLLKKQNKSFADVSLSLACKNKQLSQELSKVKEEFHNQLLSTCSYRWTISDYPKRSKKYPQGSCMKSPTFWLCGYELHLSLYPNGSKVDATGFLSLFLENKVENEDFQAYSNNSAISYRLTVISQDTGTTDISEHSTHVFTRNKSWGWPKFMKASDALLPSYCKDGSLIIKCTIEPDLL